MMKLSRKQQEVLTYMHTHDGKIEWGQGANLNTMFALESKNLVSVSFRGGGDIWTAHLTLAGHLATGQELA